MGQGLKHALSNPTLYQKVILEKLLKSLKPMMSQINLPVMSTVSWPTYLMPQINTVTHIRLSRQATQPFSVVCHLLLERGGKHSSPHCLPDYSNTKPLPFYFKGFSINNYSQKLAEDHTPPGL